MFARATNALGLFTGSRGRINSLACCGSSQAMQMVSTVLDVVTGTDSTVWLHIHAHHMPALIYLGSILRAVGAASSTMVALVDTGMTICKHVASVQTMGF